jgi:hypothetical protein
VAETCFGTKGRYAAGPGFRPLAFARRFRDGKEQPLRNTSAGPKPGLRCRSLDYAAWIATSWKRAMPTEEMFAGVGSWTWFKFRPEVSTEVRAGPGLAVPSLHSAAMMHVLVQRRRQCYRGVHVRLPVFAHSSNLVLHMTCSTLAQLYLYCPSSGRTIRLL